MTVKGRDKPLQDIIALLKEAIREKASDVHLTVDAPPVFRLNGSLVRYGDDLLKQEDTMHIFQQLANEEKQSWFKEKGEVDFSYAVSPDGRFRINAFRQRGSVAIAIRVVNAHAPTIEALGLPTVVSQLAMKSRGLILVTGPTGSGKSTTLASMVNLINQERSCHIITLEDPIEFVYCHGKSIINQREVHADTLSFPNALRAALREDPDVILVGEMRDLETISTTITAAETGHLVLATLHTADATQTVDRIIDVFPPHQQQQVRVQLSLILQGIVAQQLLPRRDGSGRKAAFEVLAATPAVRNLIREGKTHQLRSTLQTGGANGMQTMDRALSEMVLRNEVTFEEALSHAIDPDFFQRLTNQQ